MIKQNDAGQRLDRFLSKAMPELPKSMMFRLIRKKDIKINGKRCENSTLLSEGDEIRVYVKEEVSAEKKHDLSFLNVSEYPEILYEDKNLMIVFKPVGLDSHSNGSGNDDTLINRIKRYLYDWEEYLPEEENSFAPALCSRLDRNTAGLVTAAKNAMALREINSAVRDGKIHKIYRCITTGRPPEAEGVLTAYHCKDEGRNIVRISDEPKEGFREIRTGYRVISEKNGLFLVEVRLYTGRTHQIRAHLSHVGAPLLGDGKYGNTIANKRYAVFRQALCAYKLEFDLPEDSPLSYMNDTVISAPEPEFQKKFGLSGDQFSSR